MEQFIDIEKLFRLYYRPLCLFATHLLNDSDLVEDVVMDSYIKYWEKAKVGEIINPKSYLYTMVRNSCFNHNTTTNLTTTLEGNHINAIDETENLEELSMIEARLWTAIDSLPSKCRTIFLMSKRDQMSYQEIAEELHLSIKTVEVQISKAYKRLREMGKNIYHFFLSLF